MLHKPNLRDIIAYICISKRLSPRSGKTQHRTGSKSRVMRHND